MGVVVHFPAKSNNEFLIGELFRRKYTIFAAKQSQLGSAKLLSFRAIELSKHPSTLSIVSR